MLFIYFFIVAAITVLAATRLSTYADVISEKTACWWYVSIGSMLLAGVLIASRNNN
ncbi:hypothetical protein KHA80_01010 [Anaerobacillus sp. HL2]|nr:hypothetical protein KHA80_01010 [Anaerobacillus sp. HL2]